MLSPQDGPPTSISFTSRYGRLLHVAATDPRGVALAAADGDLNPVSLALWRHLCSREPWDVVVDVGANYGEMVLSFDLPRRATVFALEPSPVIADHLARSVRDADVPVHVEVVAAGDHGGRAQLFVSHGWSGTTTTTPGSAADDSTAITVDVVRLDDYLREKGADVTGRVLVKIDVEGGERSVIEGMSALRRSARDLTIQAEVIHSSDEELEWMVDNFDVHLVDKEVTHLVPVATVAELRERLATDLYYGQDAVLMCRPTRRLAIDERGRARRSWLWSDASRQRRR